MKPLFFSEASLEDLSSILEYIARDKPQAAIRFVDQLEKQCKLLSNFPELGSRREDLAPRLSLFTFRGYGIYFRNLDDRVRIERVLHPALDVQQQKFD
jgi:toxin ParE1/3/4